MATTEVSKISSWIKHLVGSDDNTSSFDGIDGIETREPRNSLSTCNKLCFAIGSVPCSITATALGFFLQIFLLDVAEVNPLYASMVMFVGRAWDAISDPIVGVFVSRSPRTRFGRMLPWVVLSTPFAVVAYFLVWFVPPFADHSKVIWYLVFYCLFETLQTCFRVPYSTLTMFISSDQKERDACSSYRMTVEVLAMLIGVAVQGQIVGMANAPCIPVSNLTIEKLNSTSTGIVATNATNATGSATYNTKTAYMMASCTMSLIYIVCAIVLFFGVKERIESCRTQSETLSFLQVIRRVVGYRPFVILNLAVLLISVASYLLQGNFAVFCTYTLGFRNDFQTILLVVMISAVLSVPFWHWFLTRFGKKTAFYVGNACVVPFVILLVCLKSNLALTYVMSFGAGVGIGASILLPWSMLPDVIDDFEVQNPDSTGHEAIFYSLYVFLWKLCSGLSMGISTLSLYFTGYVTRGCTQPDEVNLTLRLLISAVPVASIVAGLVLFYYYPVNEEKRQMNSKRLQELRSSKPTNTHPIQEESAKVEETKL